MIGPGVFITAEPNHRQLVQNHPTLETGDDEDCSP
jgi:hypothetical protein